MPKRRTLTAKQKAFVKEYLRNGQNAVRAWLVAVGKSPDTETSPHFRRMGSNMLNTLAVKEKLAVVEEKVDTQIMQSAAVMQITKERIIEELAKIAFSNATDVAQWDENGVVKYKATEDLPAEVRASIAEIQGGKTGLRIKHHDKQAALIQLGKELGLFKEKVNHEHKHQSVTFIIETD